MSPGKILKVALRSRSWSFAADYRATEGGARAGNGVASHTWRAGDGAPVHYRRGTSDVGLIYDVLLKPGAKAEYWLPGVLEPACILDIGGNIGVASRYLAHRFPQALVHAFEPVPENLELLQRNAAANPRIRPHGFGLGPETGELRLAAHDPSGYNRGGYSLFAGAPGAPGVVAPIRNVAGALEELGIDRVDIIKIDTEGAEHSILSAFPEALIARAQWIYGELHSEGIARPSDFKVLDYLARWFSIEVYKPLRKKNYFFDACRRDLGARMRGFSRYR
jgi:FkbM family methyltransferase